MTPLDEVIAYHEKRIADCDKELDHCTDMLAKNRSFTEKDCERCQRIWNDERKFARDTVAYLKTLKGKMAV